MKKRPAIVLAMSLIASYAPAFAQSRDCKSSEPDKAIEGCSADIRRDTPIPANAGMLPVYYNLRALAYEKKDMLEEAKADLDMAVSLQPGFMTYFNRAVFSGDHGLTRGALADYEAAIAAYDKQMPPEKSWDAFYAQANYRRAEILRRNDRVAEAMPNYDKAVAMQPDMLEFRYNRALAYSRLEQFDAVIADLDKVIEASPRRGEFLVSALINRGMARMRQGSFPEAIADLDKALAAEPGSPLTLARRGFVFEKAGQRDKAIADYREALKIYAKMQEALDGLRRLGVTP